MQVPKWVLIWWRNIYFSERQATEAWQQTEGGGEETPEVAETASSVNMARDHELRPAGASHQCHRQVEKLIHRSFSHLDLLSSYRSQHNTFWPQQELKKCQSLSVSFCLKRALNLDFYGSDLLAVLSDFSWQFFSAQSLTEPKTLRLFGSVKNSSSQNVCLSRS